MLSSSLPGWAATFIWSGNGTDANWSNASNWIGGLAPANNGTAAIVLAGTTQLSPNVDAAWDIGSLAFSNNAGAFVLTGNALTVRANGITNNSASGQTISNSITLLTNQTWSATSGILAFNGSINNGTNLLTVNGGFNSFITGVISGTGGLTKLGTGTNFLSGTNTYSGITTVSVGALNLQNSSALGSPAASAVVVSGATLQLQGGISVTNQGLSLNGTGVSALGALRSLTNNNVWNGPITLTGTTTIACDTNLLTLGSGGMVVSNFLATFTGTGNFLANGSIGSGTNGLTKSGVGTLTLTASNSYGGLTTVSAGILNVQNSFALGGATLGTAISSGAQLQLQNDVNISGETLGLSGTGVSGFGVLRNLGGSNSWSGLITLTGTSTINADAGTLDLEANIVNASYTLTCTNVGTVIFNGALGVGAGGLVKYGTGPLFLGGTNNYTGGTTINAGTVRCMAPGILSGASAVIVNTNGILDLNNFNQTILSLAGTGPGTLTLGAATLTTGAATSTTFAGVMSGTGSLVKNGVSTMTLSGVNTYTGGTTINGGAISISTATGIGNITNSLALNGGTLTTSGSALTLIRAISLGANHGTFNVGGTSLTLSNIVSGAGALIKTGSKILILSATNTYAGGTTNAAGTLTIASDFALGDTNGAFTFATNSTLTTTASFASSRNFFLNAATATISCGTGFTNTLNGVIAGAGALTQSGSGVMVLGGSSTFTNLFTIAAGTVRLAGSERISDLAPVLITKSTAILDLNNFNETIGSLSSIAGKVTLGSGNLTAGGNNLSRTNIAVISGTGGFMKTGTGVLIFTAANTYTSNTVVAAGTLQLGKSDVIANTSFLVISNGATFSMTWNTTNYNETVASLAGTGSINLGSGTLTAGTTGTTTFSGTISGTGAFTKIGTGTQIFNGTNSYSGATTVSQGNLQVNGGATNSAVTIASAATLSGGGTVGTVIVNSGATNSPGANLPGTLGSGSETWAGGGTLLWEINNATGAKGVNWDWLNISGALNITANAGSKFNLKIVSLNPANATGQVTNFDNTITYIWTIASAAGGISGFSAASFNINTSAFQNSVGAGTFTLSQSGNDLNLIFTSATLAAIKNVQSGTLISTNSGTNSVTLGAGVNPTNSFLVFSARHNSGVPGGSMIRGRLVNSNSVEFIRATTETSTMNIQWYVAEYSVGVKVQRGEVNQTSTTINVPLSTLSATNQAFVLWSKTPDPAETIFSDSDPVAGEITSSNNLQFRVTSAPSSVPVISYQVVEFLNPASIGVQRGTITNLTGTNLSATATLPVPVDPSGTFLLTGYRTSGSGTGIGARMLRAQLTSATNITVDRSIAGAPDDISEVTWQAIQFKDGSLVQSGSVMFTNGAAQTNIVLATSLNTNRAIAMSFVQPAGGQSSGRSPSTGNVLGVGSATLGMSSISQLVLDRNNTSDKADIGWSVIGLGPSSILAPATGGTAISADTTTNIYTSLTGPTYTEILSANVGLGTIILKTPAGFIFDTNTVQPTVLVTRIGGSGANSLNINGVASGTSVAMTTVNPTNLIFTVTNATSGGVICSLTWQNIRVRPTTGTNLATGNLVSLGTSVIQGATTNSTSWGFLAEVVGAAAKLALSTSPSSAVIAGADFPAQPVIQIQDQFGNLRASDNTNVITAVSSGTDTGDVNGSITAVGGVAAFSGLSYQVAQTNTITFSSPGLTSKTSGNIVVSAAAASQLTVVTQPSATATAGIKFSPQPVVQVQDAFGNVRKTDTNTIVVASINLGSDDLFGTQTNTAVNGVVTFTNLNYQIAETITLDFDATGLDTDTSTGIAVGAAAASQLVIQTQPSSLAMAGVPFAQQPAVQILDQFGNLCITNNSTIVTAVRNAGSGALQGALTATASAGVATFANLSHNVATPITIDFNSGGLTNDTSDTVAVSSAAAAKLVFVTQPGSATVGSIFGTQPSLVTQDAFGNNSVAGLANNLSVTLALTSGFGVLLGTTNLDIGTAGGNGSVTFASLEIDFAGSKQLTANASGLASAVSSPFTVALGGETIAFSSLSNKTYGDAAFTVSASASSGLPVTFSIVSGPASVSGNTVTISGAGSIAIRASQAGNTNYNAAASVDQSFTVAKATLIVSADNKTKTYGVANPVFTASYSGFVNGDDTNAISGSPSFSTSATTNSSVAGDPYSIVPASGTLTAANYNFNFVNGTLTVTAATLNITASDDTKIYGQTKTYGAGSTAFTSIGLQNGDTIGSVTISASGGTAPTDGINNYSLTPSAASGGTFTVNNYSIAYNNGTLTVNPLAAALTGSRTYDGTTNAAAANLSVTNSVGGDDVTLASGIGGLAGATVGTQSITSFGTLALGGTRATNYTLIAASGSMTINALAVSLTGSRAYDGTTNAAFGILSVTNTVSGDTLTVASGTGGLAGAIVGTQSITSFGTLTLGGDSATNYTLAGASGSVIIGRAVSIDPLTSSANPSLPGTNVIFTALITASSPCIGKPTGAVVFKNGATPFFTNALVNGSTTATNFALPHGSNAITAEYAGDANFFGSTDMVSQVINRRPYAAVHSYITQPNQNLVLITTNLAWSDYDADGDALNIVSVGSTSTNGPGGNVAFSPSTITYTPANNYVGLDAFTYIVSDSFGLTRTNTVKVNVKLNSNVTSVINLMSPQPNGCMKVAAFGIPGRTYLIQAAATFSGPWVNISTNVVPATGMVSCIDTDAPNYPSRYYRLALAP